MLFSFEILPGAFLFFALLRSVVGDAVNGTIDDTLGDSVTRQRPLFLPDTPGVWEDNTCAGCSIKPDKALAFDGTWTAATYNSNLGNISVTFNFTGTAIYIFFILANDQGPGITTVTECNFTLDNTMVGHFLHQPTTSLDLQYGDNAMVFSKTDLENKNYTFQVITAGADHDIFVNFDYAIYTFQNETEVNAFPSSSLPSPSVTSTSEPSSPSNAKAVPTGAIAGGVVGGIAALAILCGLFFFCRNRKDQAASVTNNHALMIEDHDDSGPPRQTYAPFHFPASNTNLNATSSQTASASQYTQSQYAPTTIGSSEFDDGRRSHERSYLNRDTISALPSGQVVMAAGIRRLDSTTTDSTVPPALPSSGTFSNPFSHSTSTASTIASRSQSDTMVQSIPTGLFPVPDSNVELRRMRQRELERQMEQIKQEMKSLQTEAAERRASIKSPSERYKYRTNLGAGSEVGDEDVSRLKEQIRMMQQQIMSLQYQSQSPWAQGLSDEPPPGYTPQ